MRSGVGIRIGRILVIVAVLRAAIGADPLSGAEHVFRVSDGVTDPGEPFELTERHFFTWGVRGFSPGPTEELQDAVLIISLPEEAGLRHGTPRIRVHLLDSAENPANGRPDEGLPPRGRLRRYEWPSGEPTVRLRGPYLPWTTQVEILTETFEDSADGHPRVVRCSLGERGLMEYFRTFLANGGNFGLAMDADGQVGRPLVRFVVITRERAPLPIRTWERPVPRIGDHPVRMPDGGSTWVLLGLGLGGLGLWLWLRRR